MFAVSIQAQLPWPAMAVTGNQVLEVKRLRAAQFTVLNSHHIGMTVLPFKLVIAIPRLVNTSLPFCGAYQLSKDCYIPIHQKHTHSVSGNNEQFLNVHTQHSLKQTFLQLGCARGLCITFTFCSNACLKKGQ